MTREEKIKLGLEDHYNEALLDFSEDRIVGLFLQGSQNYLLDYEESDIDTKLIVVPTFKDIALARKPVSTTHIRANDEHIDYKDIRLYVETFYKQNLNFLEILFTPYTIFNPLYEKEWMRLVEAREQIAHMNPWRAVKSMKGVALEKFHAMEHDYPSRRSVLAKYGYDGKQVSHLLRIEDYLKRYINKESYENCLIPTASIRQKLMDYKLCKISLEEARSEAARAINNIENISKIFLEKNEDKENSDMRELLEDVSYNIMLIAVKEEIGQNNFIIP